MSGPNNPAKRTESREKIKLNRWINKSEEELKEIWNKTLETWNENLDADNPLRNKDVVNNMRVNNLEKRGVEWVTQDLSVIEKALTTHRERMIIIVNDRLDKLNLELISEFVDVKSEVKLRCKVCNNEFISFLDYVFNGYGVCRVCNPYNSSIPEKELKDFIEEIINKEDLIYNDRKILDGKEIDIIIKSKNIGIEFDGIYYHSTGQGITENYHIDKTTKALDKGIKLIHIFEDEWQYKKEIVKLKIKEILGINTLNIENYVIKEIEDDEKDLFLEEYHIKGKDNSDIKLGIFYNNELISVMTFIKLNDNNWKLNRFCSTKNSGIGEMFNYFKSNYEWKEIFYYCDRRWSKGDEYYELGFKLEEIINPYFWYVSGFRRTDNLKPKTNTKFGIVVILNLVYVIINF